MLSAPPIVEAQFGTPRRDRPTHGAAVAELALLLGIELKPWQRYVADVALEQVDDGNGGLVPAYSTVTISVGRRAGKTLLVFLFALRKMLADHRQLVWFTAQDRQSASLHLKNDYLPLLEDSPFGDIAQVRMGNGNEAIGFPHTQSFMRLFSPLPTALHGFNSDLIVVDECFAFDLERGRDLETAMRPTTYTRPGAQIFYTSAAGDLSSTWWASLLEQGRLAVGEDRDRGHAHFEWTADETDLDLEDEATWRLVHPGGLPIDVLRAEYLKDRDQFFRTILNVTDRSGSAGSPVDIVQWRSLATKAPKVRERITLGVDASPDQQTAAVVAAYDGVVEVIDFRPGVHWVTDRVVGLLESWDVEMVAVDAGGPAGAIVPNLERAGVPLSKLVLRDVTAAAAGFVEGVRTGNVRHVLDVALDSAVEGARRRKTGDGAWSFSRQNSVQDVAPLTAASLAWHVHPDTHGETVTGIF